MNGAVMGSISTVVMFVAFVVMVFWAYSRRQKTRFEQAAELPFADERIHEASLRAIERSEDQI
jgi:cytochrome c oxidase cbb3-type subunit IV